MSNTDYEIITGLIVSIGLAAIYYFWIKIEMKTQFLQKLEETEEKLNQALEACAGEPDFSKPLRLLRQAKEWMREIKEFGGSVDLDKDLDDIVAARRQLYFVNANIDRALRLRANADKVNYLLA
ncbi:MAG: hypothetical protein JSS83_11225 [Cyanobacteria bacterium SZAS LIN-3]|nr:hypothetical protein [Cyanobacteria bacterium SZAS LIN-3]MBS2009307.1 hypothetical protein [Cyanobacteria bacterium SZAS TMP-1]